MTIEKKFEEIKSIRAFIKNTFKTLTEKHIEIKAQYKSYIDANRKCEYLDSFYFQIKLLDYDYDTTNKLYNYIDNRIYCDYYKLFVIIYSFFKLNFKTEKSEMILKNTKYPIYKDLEPYKIYDFDTINDIHQDIIRLIEYINKIIQQNEEEIKMHQSRLTSGINIDNYIHNLEYHNNIIVNNVNLYKKYLSAYHTYHISFLSNLNSKLNCIHEQLDNDINFTQPVKEKRNIIMTKICKRCSKKEAEYCETCLNEENEQYMRLSDLRNNTIVIDRDETENVMEPIIEEPVVQVEKPVVDAPIEEPVVDELVVDAPIEKPVVNEPVIVPVVHVDDAPIEESVDEPVIVPVVQVDDAPIEEPVVDEPVIVPVDVPVDEPVVNEPVIVPVVQFDDAPIDVPIDAPIDEPIDEPVDDTPVIEEPIIVQEPVIVPVIDPVIDEPVIQEILDKNVSPRQLFTIYESNVNDNALYIANTIQPDITVDNSTNTTDIERKIHNNPPFFLDMNVPKIETPKKKKKHKK
jgi:hypothetical protein